MVIKCDDNKNNNRNNLITREGESFQNRYRTGEFDANTKCTPLAQFPTCYHEGLNVISARPPLFSVSGLRFTNTSRKHIFSPTNCREDMPELTYNLRTKCPPRCPLVKTKRRSISFGEAINMYTNLAALRICQAAHILTASSTGGFHSNQSVGSNRGRAKASNHVATGMPSLKALRIW